MGRKGRKRPADAELLLKQVAEVFSKKKEELGGARKAARQLGVCLSSFYKYAAGINIPDMDVLRAAKEKWGVRWTYLDPSEVIRPSKVKSAEQLVLAFLSAVRQQDIKILEVTPEGRGILQISLEIRFPGWSPK